MAASLRTPGCSEPRLGLCLSLFYRRVLVERKQNLSRLVTARSFGRRFGVVGVSELPLQLVDLALQVVAFSEGAISFAAERVFIVRVDHVDHLELRHAGPEGGVGSEQLVIGQGHVRVALLVGAARGRLVVVEVEGWQRRRAIEVVMMMLSSSHVGGALKQMWRRNVGVVLGLGARCARP